MKRSSALLTGGVDLRFNAVGWMWVMCIVVVSTVLGMLAFFAGLARTGPSTASILSTGPLPTQPSQVHISPASADNPVRAARSGGV